MEKGQASVVSGGRFRNSYTYVTVSECGLHGTRCRPPVLVTPNDSQSVGVILLLYRLLSPKSIFLTLQSAESILLHLYIVHGSYGMVMIVFDLQRRTISRRTNLLWKYSQWGCAEEGRITTSRLLLMSFPYDRELSSYFFVVSCVSCMVFIIFLSEFILLASLRYAFAI